MPRLSIFELDDTGLIALQADQRFSYALHVPEAYRPDAETMQAFDVIIAVHGSDRPVMEYRDGFSGLARKLGCFVLAPLFPIGIIEPGEVDNYKFIDFRGLRYDLLLLAMMSEIEARYRISFRRAVMHGFSGGGQFVHRFYYLHPERLWAVSIGAPGRITLLDDTRPWWVGTSDVARRFGRGIDVGRMREVKVQLVIGADDTDARGMVMAEDSPGWMAGANDAGRNRRERLTALRSNLADHGITSRLDVVPGVAHVGQGPILDAAAAFFEDCLK